MTKNCSLKELTEYVKIQSQVKRPSLCPQPKALFLNSILIISSPLLLDFLNILLSSGRLKVYSMGFRVLSRNKTAAAR